VVFKPLSFTGTTLATEQIAMFQQGGVKIMPILRKSVVAAILLMTTMIFSGFGQVPTRTKLHFTINVPYALRMGDYTLAPGKYVLFQDSKNPSLFALYSQNLAREPIAMIYTTQSRYWTIPNDRQTKITLEIDEASGDAHPILRGWNVPFADGWDIVSVVAKESRFVVRTR